jgi:hypothetical protein
VRFFPLNAFATMPPTAARGPTAQVQTPQQDQGIRLQVQLRQQQYIQQQPPQLQFQQQLWEHVGVPQQGVSPAMGLVATAVMPALLNQAQTRGLQARTDVHLKFGYYQNTQLGFMAQLLASHQGGMGDFGRPTF